MEEDKAQHSSSPSQDDPEAQGASQPRHDLLSGAAELLDGSNCGLVVLRVEVMTGKEIKAIARIAYFLTIISFLCLFTLFSLNLALEKKHPKLLFRTNAYEISNICIGSICLAGIFGRMISLLTRCWKVHKQGLQWPPRRKRMAILSLTAGTVQAFNLMFYVASNSYVTHVNCSWFGKPVNAFGILQWVCWNTMFTIFILGAHSLNRYKSPRKGKLQREEQPLVMDAPWTAYIKDSPLWFVFTITLVMPWIIKAAHGLQSRDDEIQRGVNCRDATYNCQPPKLVQVFTIIWAVIIWIYAMLFYYYTLKTQLQLWDQPYALYRAPSILLQLQMRTSFLFFKVTLASATLLWLARSRTCWTYLETWLGYQPMHISATCFCILFLWLFHPRTHDDDAMLELYLQEPAWTEAEKPAKLAEQQQRASNALKARVQQQPLFCIETALKLHRWSDLAYIDIGQGKLSRHKSLDGSSWADDEAEKEKEDGLVKGRIQGKPSAGDDWPEGSSDMGSSIDKLQQDVQTGTDMSMEDPSSQQEAALVTRGSQTGSMTSDNGDSHTSTSEERRQTAKLDKASSRRQLAYAMRLCDLQDVQTFWDPVLDTKCLLAWNRRLVILAFRGTASVKNAKTDIKAWLVQHPLISEVSHLGLRPMVHAGFYRAWTAKGLNEKVITHLKGLYDRGEVMREAHVCVTGHSLGGALAMLAAHDIHRELSPASMQCYTYGAPYVGNTAFCNDSDRRIPDCWHLVNDKDPVPRTGKFICLFSRPGRRVIINQAGEMLVSPNPLEVRMQHGRTVKHHYMTSYRLALLAVCRMQFSVRGTAQGRAGVLSLGENAAMHADMQRDGFEWADMRKAARWGDTVIQRMRPPKKEKELHKRIFAFLSPTELLLGWLIRRQHKREQQHELSKPRAAKKDTMQHYRQQQAAAVVEDFDSTREHTEEDQNGKLDGFQG